MPKTKEFVSSSENSDSDAEPKPKKKKVQVAKESKPSPKKGGASSDGDETKFQLSRMRFISVSEFRGKQLVNIREYYEKDGELMPGRKGISLSLDQWAKLKDHIDDIDKAIKNAS